MNKPTELLPCPHCDDSGYVEFASGGIWTGENIRTRHEICDCICGDDVRRALTTDTTGDTDIALRLKERFGDSDGPEREEVVRMVR
jgi:hypothetical protein